MRFTLLSVVAQCLKVKPNLVIYDLPSGLQTPLANSLSAPSPTTLLQVRRHALLGVGADGKCVTARISGTWFKVLAKMLRSESDGTN